MTCLHYQPKTKDGGYCAVNAYGIGVMVGQKVCKRCPQYTGKARGMGDILAAGLKKIGVKPCNGCQQRREELNEAIPL